MIIVVTKPPQACIKLLVAVDCVKRDVYTDETGSMHPPLYALCTLDCMHSQLVHKMQAQCCSPTKSKVLTMVKMEGYLSWWICNVLEISTISVISYVKIRKKK